MLRQDKAFAAVLTKVQNKADNERILMEYTIRHVMEGDIQIFLNTYADKCNQENVDTYFRYPVQWKNISIEANYLFRVEFDEVEHEAVLKEIKVRRAFRKGSEYFTYDLVFQKEVDLETDSHFTSYLNQKEENDQGKKVLVEYSTFLVPLEQYMKE